MSKWIFKLQLRKTLLRLITLFFELFSLFSMFQNHLHMFWIQFPPNLDYLHYLAWSHYWPWDPRPSVRSLMRNGFASVSALITICFELSCFRNCDRIGEAWAWGHPSRYIYVTRNIATQKQSDFCYSYYGTLLLNWIAVFEKFKNPQFCLKCKLLHCWKGSSPQFCRVFLAWYQVSKTKI